MMTFKDETGLFGVFGHSPADRLARQALMGLTHRGRLGASVVSSDGHLLRELHVDPSGRDLDFRVDSRPGLLALGAVWNDPSPQPCRPLVARYHGGQLAVAMAGRFTNSGALRARLKSEGAIFSTLRDAELVAHLVARSRQQTFVNRVVDALQQVEGAFSILICSEDRLVAVRDPRGLRPLSLGEVQGATVFASDPSPILAIEGSVARPVAPGEVLVVDAEGLVSLKPFRRESERPCVWEALALLPIAADKVYTTRVALGERLAKLQPCTGGTVVVSPPGAATPFALGYARALGLPWVEALQPHPDTRWQAIPSLVTGQHVVLVLPGLTVPDRVRDAIQLLRKAGATEVHVRVASPIARALCAYGVLSSPPGLPSDVTASVIAELLGADSAGTLSLTALESVVAASGTLPAGAVCAGCLGGAWPVVSAEEGEEQLPLFVG